MSEVKRNLLMLSLDKVINLEISIGSPMKLIPNPLLLPQKTIINY